LSTLTKILIVLLAFASIFLCGIVVTYVANADSYKHKMDNLSTEKESLNKKVKELTNQINEKTTQQKQTEEKLNSEVASLNTSKSDLKIKLENAERESSSLLTKVDSLATQLKEVYQTKETQAQLLNETLEKLHKAEVKQVDDRAVLNEAQIAVQKKDDAIKSLEEEKRSLLDQKAQLQDKIDMMLNPGRRATKTSSLTPKKPATQPAPTAVANTDGPVQGTITAVDIKNSMASVSVGKNEGVKEGMKFHVIRGDEFICDIQIIDVEAGEAIGVLELVQKQPQVGDVVTTNL
jgi:predicted  nucleic acid-binding Zn-ribbon protein